MNTKPGYIWDEKSARTSAVLAVSDHHPCLPQIFLVVMTFRDRKPRYGVFQVSFSLLPLLLTQLFFVGVRLACGAKNELRPRLAFSFPLACLLVLS